jgi:hypothetical protein
MLGSLIDAFARFGGRDRGRRARAVLLAGLIPAALAASALFPAGASAATRSFHVYNFSGLPLYFNGILSGDFSGGSPAVGHVLQPGIGFDDFEQTFFVFAQHTPYEVSYAVLNGQPGPPVGIGTFFAWMEIYSIDQTRVFCTVDFGACNPQGTLVFGDTLTYLDPPGTVHDFGPGQGQAQAATLNQFCAVDNSATCKFTPTSEHLVDSPSHQLGGALVNNSALEQDTRVTISDTVGSSDSVGVDVKAGGKIAGIVDLSVTAKYSHEWTHEHTFTQDVTVHCPPYTKCFILATAPMFRDTGDFTLTLGNTTWNLPGVYLDSPNPNGNGNYEIDTQPLTASQRATLPPGVTVLKLRGVPYTLPREARANRIAEPRLHLAIAGPRVVAAGQIASYRITSGRSQPNNLLVFSLKNVQVAAEYAGHRVGHWLLSTLPRDQSRTLLLRLKVPSATRGSFCITANAAAENAHRALTRYCAAVAS